MLNIHKQGVVLRVPRARLHRLLAVAEKRLRPKIPKADINLVFITDKHMRQLNRDYRGKDVATDVLSFNLDEPDEVDGVFGEIYISAATARRQAKKFGCSLIDELLRLTAHGLLHLMGYTHETASREKRMMALQEELLGLSRDGLS